MNDSVGLLAFFTLVITIIALIHNDNLKDKQIDDLKAQITNLQDQIVAHENHKRPIDCDQAIMHWAACPMTAAMGGKHD